MFGTLYRQHGARRRSDNALGNVSKKQTFDGRPAMGPHHDQVDVRRLSVGNDAVGRVVGRFNDAARTQDPPIVLGQT
jgi:hypothetical protein